MIDLIQSPWEEAFESLVADAEESLVISSPYVGEQPCERIARAATRLGRASPLSVLLVTDLSSGVLLSGATNVAAIAALADAIPSAEVRFLPSIHAKVYVADRKTAIVTSANMTSGGLHRNIEYGVRLNDVTMVTQVRTDITDYAALGTRVGCEELLFLAGLSSEMRDVVLRAGESVSANSRRLFQRRLRAFHDDLLKVRAAGRNPHAIFAEAILYLLRRRPMTTHELHPLIQSIHPDLCDDTVDRVIEGAHFGKKWKHAVRTAQQHLKRRGVIELVGRRWRLV
jgi:hypothetical protein